MRTYVTAIFKAKEGHEAQLEELLKTVVEPTLKDKGCVSYALHRGQDDPGTFVFMEEWDSRADMDAHLGTDHIQGGLVAIQPHVDSMNIVALDRIAGGAA